MKRPLVKIAAAAAVLCLVSATAFAAGGGLDYFWRLFGQSSTLVAEDIWSPGIAVEDDHYAMSVESMLSDGYKINLIVAVTGAGLDGVLAEGIPFSAAITNHDTIGLSCQEMEEFSEGQQHFYQLKVETKENVVGEMLTLTFEGQESQLTLETTVSGVTAAETVAVAAEVKPDYYIETIQLSPLGALIIGSETKIQGALPVVDVYALMKDGSMLWLLGEDNIDTTDDGTTITGGGGIVIGSSLDVLGETLPLTKEASAFRNPDGQVITSATFGSILDLNQVSAIVINDEQYLLTE